MNDVAVLNAPSTIRGSNLLHVTVDMEHFNGSTAIQDIKSRFVMG